MSSNSPPPVEGVASSPLTSSTQMSSSSDDMDVDTDVTSPCDEAVNTFCGNWTHPVELTPEAHYNKFEEFRTSANQAFQGAFPPHRQPRNAAASVLMLNWEDDDLGVTSEVARLQVVFDQSYRFVANSKRETNLETLQQDSSVERPLLRGWNMSRQTTPPSHPLLWRPRRAQCTQHLQMAKVHFM
jgi:hypothetical protein